MASKISIVGTGRVGTAIAFALIAEGLADELVLVGRTAESARGDAADLRHASSVTHPAKVTSGSIADTAGSDIVILTAAAAPISHSAQVTAAVHEPNARQASFGANAALFREIVPKLARVSPDAVFIVVSNPVDALTRLAQDISGLPHARILGTGTLLDTMRLRTLLAERCGVHTFDLRVYILGEHGDSQVAALSSASVGGAPVGLPEVELLALAEEARDAGHQILREKGYTSHAIALATLLIVKSILTDAHMVLPVSTRLHDYHGVSDVCLSVPAIVGRAGVVRTLPVKFSEGEAAAFRAAGEAVRAMRG